MKPTFDTIRASYDTMNYTWHPKFNLFGIRNSEYDTNTFNDLVGYCLLLPDGQWDFKCYEATTDPGHAVRGNEVPKGTAIMKSGFYPRLYSKGFHKGRKDHPALIQVGKAFFYRKKGDKLFDSSTLVNAIIGANLHGTKEDLIPKDVDNFSKGCQVVRRWTSKDAILDAFDRSGVDVCNYALFQEKEVG